MPVTPETAEVSIGSVWRQYMVGSFAMVHISITRNGRLVTHRGVNM
jgi:hypothetical protein